MHDMFEDLMADDGLVRGVRYLRHVADVGSPGRVMAAAWRDFDRMIIRAQTPNGRFPGAAARAGVEHDAATVLGGECI